jgi:hypothetical protein
MRDAGFDFRFKATDGKKTVIGTCENKELEFETVDSYQQSIEKIRKITQKQ